MPVDLMETTDLIEPWIYQSISGDQELVDSIYGLDHISMTLSLDEPPVPYVHVSLSDSRDIMGVGGRRIAVDALYLIKVVDATASWDDLKVASGRINALFNRPGEVFTLPNGSLTSIRDRIIQYPEKVEGIQFRHIGGIWRIRASFDD